MSPAIVSPMRGFMVGVIEGIVAQSGWGLVVNVAAASPGKLDDLFIGAERFNALLDTGATLSMITPEVIQKLGLAPTGKKQTSLTPTGPIVGDTYLLDIGFTVPAQQGTSGLPLHKKFFNCTAIQMPGTIGECPIAIGMDVLACTGLTLLPNGKFYLPI